jgi:putative copper resistance protein D
MTADLLAAALRAFGFVALFQAAGAAFFTMVFGPTSDALARRNRLLAVISAAAAIVCFVAQQSLEAARFVGELSGVLDAQWLRAAWSSASGAGQGVRLLGLLLILAGFARASPRGLIVANLGAALALVSFLASGHTSVHPWRTLLAPLLALHLFVVAFWFGSLVPLHVAIRHEPLDRSVAILERFSRIAGWLVPLIFVAGALLLLALAPDWSVFTRPYGELVLWKLVGFAVLMLLAAYNRWRLIPALAAGHATALAPLRRSIAAELVLISAVLTITAVLTLFFSPE